MEQQENKKQAITPMQEKSLSPTVPTVLSVDTDPLKWLTFKRSLRANQKRTKELIRDMPQLPF